MLVLLRVLGIVIAVVNVVLVNVVHFTVYHT